MTELKRLFFTLALLIFAISSIAQKASISGTVYIDGSPAPFANIEISNIAKTVSSDAQGLYHINDLEYGNYQLVASYVGYKSKTNEISISTNELTTLDFKLSPASLYVDQVVVTGTKTFKRKTDSPILVNVLNQESLTNVQACNISEGLRFQPGLRVENNCQTCNYTQLRMNGLLGGYSQVLINGRPIFSPLTGLYGLEQLPTSMVDRIEVIRGGGSSLYGSSAIGGTVNVITAIPEKNNTMIDFNSQLINGETHDLQLSGNTTMMIKSENAGISVFFNKRNRGLYDHNGDQFSELPELNNTSIGTNFFFLPADNQKLEISISNLNEYRYGGQETEAPAYFAEQSEERTHRIWMGSADYQINYNEGKSSLISYIAAQHTDRSHYTGIFPDEEPDITNHLTNPPYGNSLVKTFNGGLQWNHETGSFLGINNVITVGAEYIFDDVFDKIPAYEYLIDQTSQNFGAFVQNDTKLNDQLSLVYGLRVDQHNLIDQLRVSPRASLLIKPNLNTQFRLNYASGFRAPQAFDTDLHIAFAGGGISRVQLSPELAPESSSSLSASINHDQIHEDYIFGFTADVFRTRLQNAFVLNPIGEDAFGEIFLKENGQGATVQGITLELRANYNQKFQLESGFTIQSSEFDNPVQYIDELDGITEFIRTPNQYGFATLSLFPKGKFKTLLNYIYTGTMKVPHFAGAPNQTVDEIIDSPSFSELSAKLSYTFDITRFANNIEIYGGVRNMFNAYQNEFDIGKNRDSNFVFGPAQARTVYVGMKLMM